MRIVRGITITAIGAASLVACGGSDDASGGDSFCSSVAALEESEVDPDTDPAAAVAALEDLTGKAPAEIKEEFEQFTAALKAVVDEDAEALASLDFESIESNITTIGSYIGENCEGVGSDVFDL